MTGWKSAFIVLSLLLSVFVRVVTYADRNLPVTASNVQVGLSTKSFFTRAVVPSGDELKSSAVSFLSMRHVLVSIPRAAQKLSFVPQGWSDGSLHAWTSYVVPPQSRPPSATV